MKKLVLRVVTLLVATLIPELQSTPEWHRLFIPGDIHFNDRGHRLAGLRIAAALRAPA
jgi:hypothetical protein